MAEIFGYEWVFLAGSVTCNRITRLAFLSIFLAAGEFVSSIRRLIIDGCDQVLAKVRPPDSVPIPEPILCARIGLGIGHKV